ncbi:glycosyltransferase [Confluentibacter flavum]|uniref:Capsular biosynthesis protein n=1 Tax=Confluentibacter flavum TaxID=1909700 RepID=A0A2N3HPF4_9FLAO|nr:glycosyltransferase [Confluentibacter flavum]PKQ46744.1 capsular biosynthesis protein [Confluentibacter flavum]
MTLAIISHTEHYTANDGTLVGWSPTVNEINHLLEIFDSIVHIAMLNETVPPLSTMAYKSNRITFISIPAIGGHTLFDKLVVLWYIPKIIKTVSKVLKEVDRFQLRTPTGIGVFLIPYLTLFSKRNGWYKYAGNWNQKHPPLGYRLQRFILKHQSRKVTINGSWPDQPSHCLSFENPCLTDEDLATGLKVSQKKSMSGPLTLCFVGRLEAEKGVGCILDALQLLSDSELKRIAKVHFVGAGSALNDFKLQAAKINIPIHFHGALSRHKVFEIYSESHSILLPTTASEGFPKVLAEAMAFGCIPIVSSISSIGQYIKHQEQGFLLNQVDANTLVMQLRTLFNLDQDIYTRMLSLQEVIVQRFTFAHYHYQLKTQVLTEDKIH